MGQLVSLYMTGLVIELTTPVSFHAHETSV